MIVRPFDGPRPKTREHQKEYGNQNAMAELHVMHAMDVMDVLDGTLAGQLVDGMKSVDRVRVRVAVVIYGLSCEHWH